jgi:hypothetical protein
MPAKPRPGHAVDGFATVDLHAPGAWAEALLERLRLMRERAAQDRGSDHGEARARISVGPLPGSAAEMAALLDVSFFATLLEEEGRPTRCVVS